MLESTIHKIFWVIVAVVVIGVIKTAIIDPTVLKIKDQTVQITSVTY